MKKNKENIAAMFNSIAKRYDLLNHLLSGNSDKKWRRKLRKSLHIGDNTRILDIATGTGDLAIELAKGNPKQITGIDIAGEMLKIAREKVKKADLDKIILFRKAGAEKIPFSDNQFDYVTVAFGVRNFEDLEKGLSEMLRVLVPGGRAAILEFSKPEGMIFKHIYSLYFKLILPLVGRAISKSHYAYNYLHDSVEQFPYGNEFLDLMKIIGYKELEMQKLTFGVCTIYYGKK